MKENKQLPRILRIWPEYRLTDSPLEANHFGRTLLFLELTETAPITGENLQSWFVKLLHIQRQLQGTETQISDSRFIQHIMVNTPGHYETITEMIRMDDDFLPDKNRVMSRYMLKEEQLAIRNDKTPTTTSQKLFEYRLSEVPLEANHIGRALIFTEFNNIRPLTGESLQIGFRKLLDIQTRLHGTEAQISDTLLIMHIMQNIPRRYENTTNMLRMNDGFVNDKYRVMDQYILKEMLLTLREEEKPSRASKTRLSVSPGSKPYKVTKKIGKPKGQKQTQRWCSHYRKSTHNTLHRWYREHDTGEKEEMDYSKTQRDEQCDYCTRLGHTEVVCRMHIRANEITE